MPWVSWWQLMGKGFNERPCPSSKVAMWHRVAPPVESPFTHPKGVWKYPIPEWLSGIFIYGRLVSPHPKWVLSLEVKMAPPGRSWNWPLAPFCSMWAMWCRGKNYVIGILPPTMAGDHEKTRCKQQTYLCLESKAFIGGTLKERRRCREFVAWLNGVGIPFPVHLSWWQSEPLKPVKLSWFLGQVDPSSLKLTSFRLI